MLMKTVFKKGMKVYDSVFFPKSEGKVVEIEERIDYKRVIVQFDCLDYKLSYTEQGRLNSTRKETAPTLSTSPYTLQGFEQKAPAPTYSSIRAEALKKGDYVTVLNGLEFPNEVIAKSFEALAKLIWLRDYYNEGWQPDWEDKNNDGDKYCIMLYKGELTAIEYSYTYEVLHFKTPEIRDKFLEEQRELLEIAKPLL